MGPKYRPRAPGGKSGDQTNADPGRLEGSDMAFGLRRRMWVAWLCTSGTRPQAARAGLWVVDRRGGRGMTAHQATKSAFAEMDFRKLSRQDLGLALAVGREWD